MTEPIGSRPKRYLSAKTCNRCGQLKMAELFPKVRGGGTADVCKECKRAAVSESMIKHHGKERELFERQQREHFEKTLAERRRVWDSLPDGHPYKSPKRP